MSPSPPENVAALFKPLTLGSGVLTLPNRIVLAALTRNRAVPTTVPNEVMKGVPLLPSSNGRNDGRMNSDFQIIISNAPMLVCSSLKPSPRRTKGEQAESRSRLLIDAFFQHGMGQCSLLAY